MLSFPPPCFLPLSLQCPCGTGSGKPAMPIGTLPTVAGATCSTTFSGARHCRRCRRRLCIILECFCTRVAGSLKAAHSTRPLCRQRLGQRRAAGGVQCHLPWRHRRRPSRGSCVPTTSDRFHTCRRRPARHVAAAARCSSRRHPTRHHAAAAADDFNPAAAVPSAASEHVQQERSCGRPPLLGTTQLRSAPPSRLT